MRKTKYSTEVLAPLVASSQSLSEVIRRLGLTPNGGNHRMIQARVRQAGLDTTHFVPATIRETVDRLSRELLLELVENARSLATVLRKLGLATEGRSFHELRRRLAELEIDTSHFSGQAWARGFTTETHPSVERLVRGRTYPDEVVFVENGPYLSGPNLVRRLIKQGRPYACSICGISEWCDKPLTLHLDHINGINNDQRRENLRLLCPNCHSQTDTYCNKARERAACYTYGTRAWRNWYPRQV